MQHLVAFGEITFDTVAVVDPSTQGAHGGTIQTLTSAFGGRAANVSLFASRSGLQSHLLSAAGRDFLSSGYRESLEAQGVTCDLVRITDQSESSKVFVFQHKDGGSIYFYPGAAAEMDAAWLDASCSKVQCELLCCSAGRQQLNRRLLGQLNPNLKVYAPGIDAAYCPVSMLRELLDLSDSLFLNASEALGLERRLGYGGSALAQEFQLDFYVVTRGPFGSTIYDRTKEIAVQPCPPSVVVDSTGAGDSYLGAFLATFAKTGNLLRAGRVGSVMSSFVVETMGCQTNVPSAQQFEERWQRYNGYLGH